MPEGREVGPERVGPGDVVLVSGPVGDRGVALVAAREGIAFETPIKSDVAPLAGLVDELFEPGA